MSERVCVRGCLQRGVHFADCPWYGLTADAAPTAVAMPNRCHGCAPRPARDHALICDGCFYRLRSLIRDSDDLMGRLASLADPMKATPTDKAPGGRGQQVEPPAPLDADLADAMTDVGNTLRDWDLLTEFQLEAALPDLVNVVEHVEALGVGFLDRHPLVDGVREFWSVQDAVDKWGVERRTKDPDVWVPGEDGEESVGVRAEWGDPLLNRDDAAKLAGSLRTLQRWVRAELISPEGEIYTGGVRTRLFRRSDVVRVRDEMRGRVGRPKAKGRLSDGE